MLVPDVHHAITIVIEIEVVLEAVAIKIARPLKLVNAAIVVIVFVKRVWASAVGVIIGDTIIVVIHRVLVNSVADSYGGSSPRVNCSGVYKAVSADVPRIGSL